MIRQTRLYHTALLQFATALADQDAANVAAGIRNGTLVSDLLDMIEFQWPAFHTAMNLAWEQHTPQRQSRQGRENRPGRTPVIRRRTEMYFDTKAYADAISQLAKALAELEPQSVHQLFEQDEYLLMHDLAETLNNKHPKFGAKLALLA
jgi:hypothetical protein